MGIGWRLGSLLGRCILPNHPIGCSCSVACVARMILSLNDLDRLISRAPLYMFAGFALIASEWLFGIGALSAVYLIGLGAILASVTDYRSERGLWMLAILYGVLFLGVALAFEIFSLHDAIRGAQQANWKVAVDIAIALRCQWLIVRAMASVFVHNRCLGKPAA